MASRSAACAPWRDGRRVGRRAAPRTSRRRGVRAAAVQPTAARRSSRNYESAGCVADPARRPARVGGWIRTARAAAGATTSRSPP